MIVLLFLASGAAVWLGWAADTRDREYSMGRVLGHRPWDGEDRYPDQTSTTPVGEDGPSDRTER